MNWFSYNGVRSAERYIRISDKDIFSGPKYDSTVQSIPGRDGDLICPGGRKFLPMQPSHLPSSRLHRRTDCCY